MYVSRFESSIYDSLYRHTCFLLTLAQSTEILEPEAPAAAPRPSVYLRSGSSLTHAPNAPSSIRSVATPRCRCDAAAATSAARGVAGCGVASLRREARSERSATARSDVADARDVDG